MCSATATPIQEKHNEQSLSFGLLRKENQTMTILPSQEYSVYQLIQAKNALLKWYGSKEGGALKDVELENKVRRVMRNQFGDACDEIEIEK